MVDTIEDEAVAAARAQVANLRDTLGERHPDCATALNRLASLLIARGGAQEAEGLLLDAATIRRNTLGDDHPDYATNLSTLAGLLWSRGELKRAEPMLAQAASIRDTALGSDHPRTRASRSHLNQLHAELSEAMSTERNEGPSESTTTDPGRTLLSPAPDDDPRLTAAGTEAPDQPDLALVDELYEAMCGHPGPECEAARDPVACHDDFVQATVEGRVLKQRFEGLLAEFRHVGETAVEVFARWNTDGVPCDVDFVAHIQSCLETFSRLRDDVVAQAKALQVRPGPDGVESVDGLGRAVDSVCDAARRHAENETARASATGVLARISQLRCAGDSRVDALEQLKTDAAERLQSLARASAWELGPDAQKLADGSHAFNAVLCLAEATDAISDDTWANAFERVERELGRPLAVALGRGKIRVQSD